MSSEFGLFEGGGSSRMKRDKKNTAKQEKISPRSRTKKAKKERETLSKEGVEAGGGGGKPPLNSKLEPTQTNKSFKSFFAFLTFPFKTPSWQHRLHLTQEMSTSKKTKENLKNDVDQKVKCSQNK